MSYRRDKKTRKKRGSRTCGWGAGKRHRGKGSRGGKGRSGSGKRGQHKKLTYYGEPAHEKGGYKIPRREVRAINLDEILKFEKAGVVDLTAAGFDKVLGAGRLVKKVIVKVKQASGKAVEKIQKIGGKVEGLIEKEPEEKKEIKADVPKEQTTSSAKAEVKQEKSVKLSEEKTKTSKTIKPLRQTPNA